MPLNGSGPISLGGATTGESINLENGQPATAVVSLNDAAVRSLAGVPSGTIIMPTNFWGKSNSFAFNLTSGTDLNLRTQALAAGWNGSSNVVATIPVSNTIQSSSTAVPALTISGSFPGGVRLINNGSITGRGGNGGSGGTGGQPPQATVGNPGSIGGVALSVSVSAVVDNTSGVISGGGGGGGGGGGATSVYGRSSVGIGGSGGGGGIGVSTGGAGGGWSTVSIRLNGNPGNAGTISAFGTGGAAASTSGASGGAGGNGGGLGSGGATGGTSSGTLGTRAGGAGGASGNSISGNSNITWIAFGTRNGPIV